MSIRFWRSAGESAALLRERQGRRDEQHGDASSSGRDAFMAGLLGWARPDSAPGSVALSFVRPARSRVDSISLPEKSMRQLRSTLALLWSLAAAAPPRVSARSRRSSASPGRRRRPSARSRRASTPRSAGPTSTTGWSASRPPAPRRLALRQGERRVDRGPVPLLGLRDADRGVRGAVPDPEEPRLVEMVAPTPFRAALAEPALAGGRDLGPDGRAAADLQRLLDRRRRHRRARLRQLRRARRLRGARAARHRRQGQDRDRALRRLVARHQAEGRGRARRDRLPHLLRPARRRLLPGRRLPEGRLPRADAARSAARWPTCRSTPAIR